MGKFDDQGFFGPNKFKKSEKHPSHTGLVNLSHETLKALLAAYQDTGEAKLEIAGWRKTDKPDMISLKVQLPKEKDDRGGRSSGRGEDRSRGSYRRDDDRGRDPAERRFSEGEGRRSRDDDFPGDRVRGRDDDRRDSRRGDPEERDGPRYGRNDYGDDRDL